jgi:hypothetical protein
VESQRVTVWGQTREKVSETPNSTNELSRVACVYNSSYTGGIGRSILV